MLAVALVPTLCPTPQGPGFFHAWVWPANGSGGIPGDIVATGICVFIAAILWPPTRKRIIAFLKVHFVDEVKGHVTEHFDGLHSCMDGVAAGVNHIIESSPDEFIPPMPKEVHGD